MRWVCRVRSTKLLANMTICVVKGGRLAATLRGIDELMLQMLYRNCWRNFFAGCMADQEYIDHTIRFVRNVFSSSNQVSEAIQSRQ